MILERAEQSDVFASDKWPATGTSRQTPLWEHVLRFYDETKICAEFKYGTPVPDTAKRQDFAHVSDADWRRIQNYHMFQRLMQAQDVPHLDLLPQMARTHLEYHVAAHVLTDAGFEALMSCGNPFPEVDYAGTRALWLAAQNAPLPLVSEGEPALAALARLHWHVGPITAYDLGRKRLEAGKLTPATHFWPLITHAITRHRSLSDGADQRRIPSYGDLLPPERDAVLYLHAALSTGQNIDDLLDDLMVEALDLDQLEAGEALALCLRRFQREASKLLTATAMPHPLPNGPVADKPDTELSLCDAALRVVFLTHALI
ncbi:hypothetical protein [Primorskyibacter sp. S187A]|uniref:hypothetical protein n=1 Tax=Primorskyibacter sp. S187A TaxID=3415130 RepID=UPI003C7E82D9